MTAFASFAKNNDKGHSTKIGYTIARNLLAILLIIIAIVQGYLYYDMGFDSAKPSIYTSIVNIALVSYLIMFSPSDISMGKKTLKVIGYSIILISINALGNVITEFYSVDYRPIRETNWAVFIVISAVLFTGLVLTMIGNKISKQETTINNNELKYILSTITKIVMKYILSFVILIYIFFSLWFIHEGNGNSLSLCGLFFYIPCFSVIVFYYLYLIWSKNKITGDKVLLLPLLQKINLFRSYSNSRSDRIVLAKTTLPFLLSLIIFPILTTIFSNMMPFGENDILIILLLIPPIILIYNCTKLAINNWTKQSDIR